MRAQGIGPAVRILAALAAATLLRVAVVHARAPQTAEAAVRAAILERVGAEADVAIRKLDPQPSGLYREARPDPSAVLGKPIRFTLVSETGSPIPVVADVEVVADHAKARTAIGRNHVISADDLEPVRAALQGVPLRFVTSAAALAGARALRPIEAGAIVQTSFVAAKRAVEPGDRVTVVAVSGPIEVSAVLIAADGGPIGATIRVLNPETKRVVKGRIVGDGRVEVLYGR